MKNIAKHIFILLAFLLCTLEAFPQGKVYTRKAKLEDFPISTTKVVIDGNSFLGIALREEIALRWRISPYEHCTPQEYEQLKTNHIQRLQAGQCTLELGFIYNDCINNFERVADHCSNIAVAALESADAQLLPHDYLNDLSHGDHADYRQQVADYRRKYLDILTGQA